MLEVTLGVLEATLTTQIVIYYLFLMPEGKGNQYSFNILCALSNWI